MLRCELAVVAVSVIALTAACGGSTSNNPSPNPSTPTASASAPPSGVATTLDPCLLVTSAEASKLTGAKFGAGLEKTISASSKQCIYGYQTVNVFTVGVVQASSVAEAQAAKQDALASMDPSLAAITKVTQVPTFADGAVEVQASNSSIFKVSAIFALHGTIAFGFSDVAANHAVPTNAAMLAQATVMLSRLP
jgi:hypothetical protein